MPTTASVEPLRPLGFWDAYGTAASVDWCEPNYTLVPWIAEFWNTVSSLVILAAGLYGLVMWWRWRGALERRFAVCFAGLAVVGAGSTLFHGTLLKLPQASDELPMIWLSLVYFFCLVTRAPDTPKPVQRRWAAGLSLYGAVFTAAYFWVSNYFALFLTSYIAFAGYVCIGTWKVAFRESDDPRMRALFGWSVGAFVGGFLLLWIPERGLGCSHGFQAIQPHAWFHLITGAMGPYAWILLAALERLLRQGKQGQLDVMPVPFVRPVSEG